MYRRLISPAYSSAFIDEYDKETTSQVNINVDIDVFDLRVVVISLIEGTFDHNVPHMSVFWCNGQNDLTSLEDTTLFKSLQRPSVYLVSFIRFFNTVSHSFFCHFQTTVAILAGQWKW